MIKSSELNANGFFRQFVVFPRVAAISLLIVFVPISTDCSVDSDVFARRSFFLAEKIYLDSGGLFR